MTFERRTAHMALSESAARGEKSAATAAVLCYIASALSVLTLDILLAVIGFYAAGQMKKGSVGGRNLCIFLRIADIIVLAVMLFVIYRFTSAEIFRIAVVPAIIIAAFEMIIFVILSSGDVKAFFNERSLEQQENNDNNFEKE